jgi:hypothetical protein
VRLPVDLVYGTPSERNEACNTVDEYVDQLENNMSIAYEYAREMLNKVAITRKERYDCNVKVT